MSNVYLYLFSNDSSAYTASTALGAWSCILETLEGLANRGGLQPLAEFFFVLGEIFKILMQLLAF